MDSQHVAWLLTLATVWSFVMVPFVVMYTITKFMDIMRRRHDDEPW